MSNYITEFLKNNNHIGADNGIKAVDILATMGRDTSEDSKRHLTKEIQRFRREWCIDDGADNFILSDTINGYYLPKTNEEIIRFFNSQNKRAKQSFITVREIRKYLKNKRLIKKGD